MDGVNDFYVDTSYDLTSLDATVTPLVTLPQSKSWYATTGPAQLQDDAREPHGWRDTTRRITTATSWRSPRCRDTTSVAWPMSAARVSGSKAWVSGVTAHELGHNYGLWHANFWDTTTNGSMIGPGTNLEYGNIYDTMGAAAAGAYQFNAAHKTKLDWLNADAVQVILHQWSLSSLPV